MKTREQILFYAIFIVFAFFASNYAQKASAEYISSLTPPSLTSGQNVRDGVQHLTYHNNILYVIDVWAGIQVVDVADVTNPKEIGRFQNDHRARNLFIQNDYGYMADELGGIHILDIKNPRHLTQIGKIETIGDAWWVEANYPYVYVAEEKNGVQAYDISDINSPKSLGKFDTPGWAWGLKVEGDLVYVADKTGGLQIIDFTDKNNPVRIGQFQEPNQAKSIYIENNYLFLTDGPNGLYILDISNPKFPALVSKINTDGFVFDVFKGGKYLYIANESKSRLEIVNLTDIRNPVFEASYQADDKIFGVWKEDVYVFVAANNKTLILRHNSPPVLAEIEDQTTNEMQMLTITPQGYDPDGDAVHFEIENLPKEAQFDSLSGLISWTPTYDQSGLYNNITLRIIENTASKLSAERSFSITVNHVNRAPSIPEIENYSVNENVQIKFTIQEGADEDIEDKGKLSYLTNNLPDGASFDSTSRTFTWTPSFEQSGTYVIDFIVKDPPGAQARDASTITVAHIDRKPIINSVADQSAMENQLITFVISGNDPDKEDQNAISYKAENLPIGAKFDKNSHTLSWTPSYEQSGSYTNIAFIMTAGKLSDTTFTNISVSHVSRPPSLANIGNKSIEENKLLTFSISGTDPDSEDQDKNIFSVTNLPSGASFNPDSLHFSWRPDFEQSGIYSGVTFTITDGAGLTDSKTIDINVIHINRPPVLQDIPPASGDENVTINFTVTGSDLDKEDVEKIKFDAKALPEGAVFENNQFTWTPSYDQSGNYNIEFSISDGPTSERKTAVLTINHVNRAPILETIPAQSVAENNKIEFKIVGSDPDKEDAGNWKISVTSLPEGAAYNEQTATVSWTPSFEQAGSYKLTVINTDPMGLTASMDVEIIVTHVNRTPAFSPISAQVTDENLAFKFVVEPGTDPDIEDKDKLVYSAQNLPDGSVFDATTRTFTWSPTFDQAGVYEIPITCSDGEFSVTQPLTITVNHVNRAPQISNVGGITGDENQLLNTKIDYSDPDKEDDGKLTISIDNLPSGAAFDPGTGVLSWTPSFDQAGNYPDQKVKVLDPAGLSAEQSFSIQINNVNRPPVFNAAQNLTTNENVSLSTTFKAEDPDQEDNGKLQYGGENLPRGASLDPASGTLTWLPDYTQAGEYTITLTASDPGGLSATTTANVSVTNVNRPPTIQNIENRTIDENSSTQIQISSSDEDTDNKLTYSAEGLPRGAEINEESGTITWTPDYNQAGTYNIAVKVSDGEAAAQSTFTLTVNNINRAPSINSGGSATVLPGETAELSFTASDADGDQLSFESDDLPSGASLNSSTGKFIWTPDENQVGTHSFNVRVSDGTDTDATSGSVTVSEPPQKTEDKNE